MTRAKSIIDRYKRAFRLYHGYEPTVTRHGSWYCVHNANSKHFRLSELEAIANLLEEKTSESFGLFICFDCDIQFAVEDRANGELGDSCPNCSGWSTDFLGRVYIRLAVEDE